eukprot:Skav209143  [mRNA]  locus=scaffold2337:5273:8165:+ [translate_table: standard]
MARTKATSCQPPSATELSDLAKKVREEKDAKRPGSDADVPKAKKARVQRELITEEDLLIADTFDPRELNFVLSWDNFDRLKSFYKMGDYECTCIHLAMIGKVEEGKKLWSKYQIPGYMFSKSGKFDRSKAKGQGLGESDAKAKSAKESMKEPLANGEDSTKEPSANAKKSMEPPVNAKKSTKKAPENAKAESLSDVRMKEPEEEDGSDDSSSSSDEDLLSGSSSHPSGPPDDEDGAPKAVARPDDLDLDCDDDEAIVKKPEVTEPEKVSTDHAALDAKWNLKNQVEASVPEPPSRLLSCETLVLGQQDLSAQASVVHAKAVPEDCGNSERKIDTIISKGSPVYDEDAPDCAESVRFWCSVGGKRTEREKVSITGQASVRTKITGKGIAALADTTSSLASSGTKGAPVSLASLVQIAENCKGPRDAEKTPEEPSAKDEKVEKKAKKGKDKDKKAKKEEPKTTQERKDFIRNFSFANIQSFLVPLICKIQVWGILKPI